MNVTVLGRFCMDSAAIASTYGAERMFACARGCAVAMLMTSSSSSSLGRRRRWMPPGERRPGKPAVPASLLHTSHQSPSPPAPPAPLRSHRRHPPDRGVIKKGSPWPPPPVTVHTNDVPPFRRETCRIRTSHFHLQKSTFSH